MQRSFKAVRLVVVQPEESVYFDKRFDDALSAMDKFNYFCGLAKINYVNAPEFVFSDTERYKEITVYFPDNDENEKNQSGFVQVSMYFEAY